MSTDKNLEFFEGEEDTIDITISDSDGDPVDLSGLDVKYIVVDHDEKALIEKDANITSAGDGELEITFDSDDTTNPVGTYRHELRLEGTDYKETVMTGDFTIRDSAFEK